MPGDALVYDLALELLTAADALLGADSPAVRYVCPAIPALDCPEQLTVHGDSILKDLVVSSGTLEAYSGVNRTSQDSVGLILTITRRTPVIPDPSKGLPASYAADMTAAAQRLLTDVLLLYRGIQNSVRTGALWSSVGNDRVSVGPVLPLPESGGTAGWVMTWRISLP